MNAVTRDPRETPVVGGVLRGKWIEREVVKLTTEPPLVLIMQRATCDSVRTAKDWLTPSRWRAWAKTAVVVKHGDSA